MTENKHTRALPAFNDTLDQARALAEGDRYDEYGHPAENFQRIAKLWSEYKTTQFTPADVAAMMTLLKISRLTTDPTKADTWVDMAAYAALGAEVTR